MTFLIHDVVLYTDSSNLMICNNSSTVLKMIKMQFPCYLIMCTFKRIVFVGTVNISQIKLSIFNFITRFKNKTDIEGLFM